MKTSLNFKEIDDNELDYLNMELTEFCKLDKVELGKAYSKLMKCMNPVFTGSIDPAINNLDFKKISELIN